MSARCHSAAARMLRLAHEGRREAEAQRLAVEARQHDLAAVGQARDRRCRGCDAVAADVVDGAVVAPRVLLGRMTR
jgi:hypothetical protein